jgi:hypothetical protein
MAAQLAAPSEIAAAAAMPYYHDRLADWNAERLCPVKRLVLLDYFEGFLGDSAQPEADERDLVVRLVAVVPAR